MAIKECLARDYASKDNGPLHLPAISNRIGEGSFSRDAVINHHLVINQSDQKNHGNGAAYVLPSRRILL
jgi:hypothetical protein